MEVIKINYFDYNNQEDFEFIDPYSFDVNYKPIKELNISQDHLDLIYIIKPKDLKLNFLESFIEKIKKPIGIVLYFEKRSDLILENNIFFPCPVRFIFKDDSLEQKKGVFEDLVTDVYKDYSFFQHMNILKKEKANLLNQKNLLQKKDATFNEALIESKKETQNEKEKIYKIYFSYKDLYSVISLEDFFYFIKEKVKTFTDISSINMLSVQKHRMCLFKFDGMKTYKKFSSINHQMYGKKMTKEDLKQKIADLTGFPIGNGDSFCFDLDPFFLLSFYFEHQMKTEDQKQFKQTISSIKKICFFLLDRINKEKQLKDSYLAWKNTFNSLTDPISLKDTEGSILKTNMSFDKYIKSSFKELNNSIENKIFKIKKQNKIFQKESFLSRKNSLSPIIIERFLDITDYVIMKQKSLLSEKMKSIGHLTKNFKKKITLPLKKIDQLSHQINYKDMPEEIQNDFNKLFDSINNCESVLNNLMDFLSTQSNSDIKKIDLNESIKKTIPFLKTALSCFKYKISLTKQKLLINAVPQLIQQVIFNIIHNACQSMKPGGELLITTQIIKNSKILLIIQDTGCGMSTHTLDQIFDPFFTTKNIGEGTGLGLSLSKNIIEKFQGSIEVDSKLRVGTKFSIFFPYQNIESKND